MSTQKKQQTKPKKPAPKFEPIREDDAARRRYSLNIDWLQLYCIKTGFFVEDGTNCWGYTTKLLDHGSKYWKKILDVYDNEGLYIGQLTTDPHKKEVNQSAAMFKLDNSLLYEEYAIDRALAAIQNLGLQYQGITRIDIAYDCNELYNGLQVPNLVKRYIDSEYLKCGQNNVILFMNMGYHGITAPDGSFRMYNVSPHRLTKKQIESRDKQEAEQKAACESVGLPAPEIKRAHLLDSVPQSQFGSITWGTRSQDVQVQIYDKSKELREVKMKHHIVHAWQRAGLNLKKPIYRIEIRIQNRGKMLMNMETGKYFNLDVNDTICQAQLEQLFFDYAEKYLKFYHNDGHEKLQNCKRLRILSLCNGVVTRPKNAQLSKDYTRGTAIALHEIDRQIVANQRENNSIVRYLYKVRQYLVNTYDLHKAETEWMLRDLAAARLGDGEYKRLSPEEYFEQRLKGAPQELAARAAAARAQLEDYLNQRRSEFREDVQRRLKAGESIESIVRTTGVSYDALCRERGVDSASYVYPEVAALRPTIEAIDKSNIEEYRKKLHEKAAALRNLIMSVPPISELPPELKDGQQRLAFEKLDTVEILNTIDDCPF